MAAGRPSKGEASCGFAPPCSKRSGLPAPYAESRPLNIRTVDLAAPGPGEVTVRIAAAGLCHSDLSVIDGNRPRPLPMVLGHEAAGVVEALGAGVGDLAVGDHVVCVFVPSCGTCEYLLRGPSGALHSGRGGQRPRRAALRIAAAELHPRRSGGRGRGGRAQPPSRRLGLCRIRHRRPPVAGQGRSATST